MKHINQLSKKAFSVIIFITVAVISLNAQNYLEEYWRQPVRYIDDQSREALREAGEILRLNPPATTNNIQRRLALTTIDQVVHGYSNPDTVTALLDFLYERMQHVNELLSEPLNNDSLQIIKMYNAGFIVRDRKVTIAVDITSKNGTLVPDKLMRHIVEQCDILFVTHSHSDHCGKNIIDMFLADGKPVVADDKVYPNNKSITHFRNIRNFSINLPNGVITVNSLPGHQDDLNNNCYIISLPCGKTFAHLGDQQDEDLDWMKGIYKTLPVIDALIINCWTPRFTDVVGCFNPHLLISSHENEFSHSIDHREAYWLTFYKYDNVFRLKIPYVVMTWGEKLSL